MAWVKQVERLRNGCDNWAQDSEHSCKRALRSLELSVYEEMRNKTMKLFIVI